MMSAYAAVNVFQQLAPLTREDAPLEDTVLAPSVEFLVDDPLRFRPSRETSGLCLVRGKPTAHEPVKEWDPPVVQLYRFWRIVGAGQFVGTRCDCRDQPRGPRPCRVQVWVSARVGGSASIPSSKMTNSRCCSLTKTPGGASTRAAVSLASSSAAPLYSRRR